MKPSNNREGFWFSEYDPLLPMPVASETGWTGKTEFIKALVEAESGAQVVHYRGFSSCRLCDLRCNGTKEYTLTRDTGTWRWPEGYRHYVLEHNVRPSLAFQEFILGHKLGEVP